MNRTLTIAAVAVLGLAILACGDDAPATGTPAAADGQQTPQANYVGSMRLTPSSGPVGTEVTVEGNGFDANADLTLAWQRVTGRWNVNAEEGTFHGREFESEFVSLASIRSDERGDVQATFTVPVDFGFLHDVALMQDGIIRNKSAFNIEMQVSLNPASGPAGTPVTIEATGIGWQYLENSWQVTYDNKYTGWLSSVTTSGVARGELIATGAPGEHVLQVVHGWSHVPYLNNQQSPRPDRPQFALPFTVTDEAAILPPAPEQQGLPLVRSATPPDDGNPAIWADIERGPVGMPLVLAGRNLPDEQIELRWFRVVGNRVSGSGWAEEYVVLGTAEPDAQGRLAFSFEALDDLGGPHRIEAVAGDQVVAQTVFDIKPSAFAVEGASGPVGTVARFHLKGVGWTETANIYTVTYDNAYIGFACGFNSQGDIEVLLPLSGEPGIHYVSFYPAIYRGEDVKGAVNFRLPQLTYAADHPGEELPAFHFAVEVSPGGEATARQVGR